VTTVHLNTLEKSLVLKWFETEA